jgi:hypothetical protein
MQNSSFKNKVVQNSFTINLNPQSPLISFESKTQKCANEVLHELQELLQEEQLLFTQAKENIKNSVRQLNYIKTNIAAQANELFQRTENQRLYRKNTISVEIAFDVRNIRCYKFTERGNPMGVLKDVNNYLIILELQNNSRLC